MLLVARHLEAFLGGYQPRALLIEQVGMDVLGTGAEGVEGTALTELHITIVGKLLYDSIVPWPN